MNIFKVKDTSDSLAKTTYKIQQINFFFKKKKPLRETPSELK